MITKIENANVELDEYTIICSVNYDTLEDFIDIVKKELDQWESIEITLPIRQLVLTIE